MGSTKWSAGQQRHMLHENYKLWNEKFADDEGEGAIGLDFSMTATGFVHLDVDGELIEHTTIKTKAKDGTTAQRLNMITAKLREQLQDQKPKVIGYESVNVQTHVTALKALSRVSGAFFQVMADYTDQVPYLMSANVSTLKKAATNDVKAQKSHMLMEVYIKWDERMDTDDEADAFVCAKLGSKIPAFFDCYEQLLDEEERDLADVLMDIGKNRHDRFYELCEEQDITKTETDALVGTFTGSRKGGNGLKQLKENDTDFYYAARKRLKKI